MKAVLHTNYGDITLELETEKAPETSQNFAQYVKDGFFNGTIFHRVIDNFMVQGGGFDENMQQKETRAPIKNEAANGLPNKIGAVAMARTSDPHSASAQFFINVADNHFLNHDKAPDGWGYAVFAQVTDGMDVVNKIRKVKTGSHGFHQDVPKESVIVETAELLDD